MGWGVLLRTKQGLKLLSEVCGADDWNRTDLRLPPEFNESMGHLRWVAYKVTMPVIIVSGLLGNIMNLAVLTRPALRGVTYVYLSGLAIADLGVMLCVVPMVMRLNRCPSLTYAAAFFHAHAELVATNSCMAASIFIVVCLTIDRYISVCLPTKFRSVHTRRNARVAIATSYALAVAISCPLTALKSVCVIDPGPQGAPLPLYAFQENTPVTHSTTWLVYLWTSETAVRFGPAVILATLNLLIICKFRNLKSKRKRFRQASDKFRSRHLLDSTSTAATNAPQAGLRNRNYKEERRLVVLLTSIIVLFFVTMTPSAFLSLLYSEQRNKDLGFQAFRAAANNLEIGNFALNFYVYFLCSKEFRRVFLSVFARGPCAAPTMAADNAKDHQGEPDDAALMEDFSRNGTTVRPSPDQTRSPNIPSPTLSKMGEIDADDKNGHYPVALDVIWETQKTKQIEETYCIRLSTGPAGNNGSKPPDEPSLTWENKTLRARNDWQAQPTPRAGCTCAVTSSRFEKVPHAQHACILFHLSPERIPPLLLSSSTEFCIYSVLCIDNDTIGPVS
uniref:G-protein coupled receptors family 1 profile domain-containing protein n=1 Tax=Timema monikensis TaxID=170555 RepID=A0A7R9E5Y7_9NEOP|nr:unnamed protein product [Timema monikensis]